MGGLGVYACWYNWLHGAFSVYRTTDDGIARPLGAGTTVDTETDGESDSLLYAPDPVDGSRTGSPDSSGFIFEGGYVFREKFKFVLQYTAYDKFNGSSSNYDGSGRDAYDNNTLYALIWLMF